MKSFPNQRFTILCATPTANDIQPRSPFLAHFGICWWGGGEDTKNSGIWCKRNMYAFPWHYSAHLHIKIRSWCMCALYHIIIETHIMLILFIPSLSSSFIPWWWRMAKRTQKKQKHWYGEKTRGSPQSVDIGHTSINPSIYPLAYHHHHHQIVAIKKKRQTMREAGKGMMVLMCQWSVAAFSCWIAREFFWYWLCKLAYHLYPKIRELSTPGFSFE